MFGGVPFWDDMGLEKTSINVLEVIDSAWVAGG
jgi:hypothetical protein